MSIQNEEWSNKELIEFLTLSNNALRLENQRLKDENKRLIMLLTDENKLWKN